MAIAGRAPVIALVGCGVMGRGIAQVAAAADCPVLLFDAREGAAREACDTLAALFDKLQARGKMTTAAASQAKGRLTPVTALRDLATAEILIEAIVESLDAKRQLMAALEDVVPASCLIATNTSSLSVTAIAAQCRHPGRVGGYHFFNPVPLMKVVEVIDGALTEAWVGDALTALSHRLGHRPVRARDTPGFIVNHAGRGYGTEALKILGETVADVATIDRILKGAAGFRMGPFELLDLTGLDVSHPVMESIYRQYYDEPRFRPSPIAAQRLMAGLLGRKSGRGFYDYAEGTPNQTPVTSASRPTFAWVAPGHNHVQVTDIVRASGVPLSATSDAALCVVPLLGEDASSACTRLKLDARRSVGIDAVFGVTTHRTLVATPATSDSCRMEALGMFTADGAAASLIQDSVGAVAQRTIALIVNIASDIAQQNIATPQDIDAAVTLGLGYPQGPLAWGDAIGPQIVADILSTMLAITGDPRYRPSPWLRRRAQLGLSLLHPAAGN